MRRVVIRAFAALLLFIPAAFAQNNSGGGFSGVGGSGGGGGSSGANPTATAGPAAVNGSATTFLRSDGAPAVQLGSATQKGILQVDGTSITASAGVISATGASGANPSATAGPTANNGVATTFMRSDASPAVQQGSATQKGIVQADGTTITASTGILTAVQPTAANPTGTAGPTAVNGSASTFLRSDGAPAVQKASASIFGIVEVDGTSITASAGVISATGASGANPSATAGPTANNGVATTFMRSDASPAVQKATNAQFGIAEGDGQTVTCTTGVCSATAPNRTASGPTIAATDMGGQVNASAGTVTVGAISSTLFEAGAQLVLANTGTGPRPLTGSGVASINAGAGCNTTFGIPQGDTWFMTGNSGTSIDCIQTSPNNATALATGSSTGNTLTAPRQYFVCTAACTVTPPVPAAGYEFCVLNGNNISGAITLGALGSSAMYQNTAATAYGTAGTGTFVSGGATGDKVCIVGLDTTHYITTSFNGTWTAS